MRTIQSHQQRSDTLTEVGNALFWVLTAVGAAISVR
jgi:hypothetical protein